MTISAIFVLFVGRIQLFMFFNIHSKDEFKIMFL